MVMILKNNYRYNFLHVEMKSDEIFDFVFSSMDGNPIDAYDLENVLTAENLSAVKTYSDEFLTTEELLKTECVSELELGQVIDHYMDEEGYFHLKIK